MTESVGKLRARVSSLIATGRPTIDLVDEADLGAVAAEADGLLASSRFPGLPDGAAAWIEAQLPDRLRSARMVADTARSVVARVESAGNEVFFYKADRILPPAEAVVLEHLARRWPDRVASVVALDPERGWSLTRDAGAPGLDGAKTDDWCRVVRRFAEIQRDAGLDIEAWIDAGCRDVRGERLLRGIEAMLADAYPRLEADVRQGLDRLRPRIAEACASLSADVVPAALVHQDLVSPNIALRGGEPVFLDWSDCVVGHPFFGCDRLLDACWEDAERKAAVIDAYLSAFTDLASPERLRASFQHVLWLRVLYEDLRWHDELQAVDPHSAHAELLRRDIVLGLTQMVSAHA